MSKMTLDSLRELRQRKQQEMAMRDPDKAKETQVIVGMGTCGIAAGAKDTFGAIIDSLAEKGITDTLVRQTGCMGMCHSEPTVEVVVPGMPAVIYGRVDAAIAKQIVQTHIIEHKLLDSYICDRPAIDIIK